MYTGTVPEEDLLVAVEWVDDELHHPVDLCLEGVLLCPVPHVLHLRHTQTVQLNGLLLPSNNLPPPRQPSMLVKQNIDFFRRQAIYIGLILLYFIILISLSTNRKLKSILKINININITSKFSSIHYSNSDFSKTS